MGGVFWASTKGVNCMVWVNMTARVGGWCVVGWYQECEWYGVGKQNGESWWVVCGVLLVGTKSVNGMVCLNRTVR